MMRINIDILNYVQKEWERGRLSKLYQNFSLLFLHYVSEELIGQKSKEAELGEELLGRAAVP